MIIFQLVLEAIVSVVDALSKYGASSRIYLVKISTYRFIIIYLLMNAVIILGSLVYPVYFGLHL